LFPGGLVPAHLGLVHGNVAAEGFGAEPIDGHREAVATGQQLAEVHPAPKRKGRRPRQIALFVGRFGRRRLR